MLEGSGFGPGIPGHLFYKGTILGPFAPFQIELSISAQLLDTKLKKMDKHYLYGKSASVKIDSLQVATACYAPCV